jgi:hypothetical protein
MTYERDSKKQLFVSKSVFRALWLLGKSKSTDIAKITADELADGYLRAMISSEHPQLFEHQKQIDKMEKELLKTLGMPVSVDGKGSVEARQQENKK